MITFYSISTFRQHIKDLLKVKRGVYAGVRDEINKAFEGASLEVILNNRDMILLDEEFIVIKLRLPDKKHKLARKDGFRFIYMAYKHVEKVIFLDVYPKNGPLQKLSITDNELLDLLEEYYLEASNNQLIEEPITTPEE